MNRSIYAWIGAALCLLTLAVIPVRGDETAPREVTLTKRTDNKEYGTSVYSFRLATQDGAVHRNYVDLVFSGCGLLHINPVAGMSSRVVDLGAVPFKVPDAKPPEGAAWHQEYIKPQAGHVYFQDVKDAQQNFGVVFVVTEASADTVKLRWQPVDPAHKTMPLEAGRGAAGRMGQCGGTHKEE